MDVHEVVASLEDRSGDLPIAAVARLQVGLIQTIQLLELGLSQGGIRNRRRRGRLHQVHRGVHLVGHDRITVRGEMMAAILACRHAVLTHRSSLELWGILPPAGPPHHVSVPSSRANRAGIIVHQTTSIPTDHLAALDRIPLTTPARSLLDFAEHADPRELEQALDEARIARLIGSGDLEELRNRAPGRRGWGALTRLLAAEREPGFSRSEAERRLLRLVRSAALPEPIRNAKVHGWEVDLFWPEQGLVVEFDSWAFHGGERREPFERDRRKAAELQSRGITVLQVTWRQLVSRPEWVIARIATALATRPAPGRPSRSSPSAGGRAW